MGPPFPTWGEGGILQWFEDHTVLMNLDDEANVRDLMSRLHTPLLQQEPKAETNRYSLYREYCYGEERSEIMRRYLDSGVLKLLTDKYLEMLKKGEQHPKGFRIGHILVLLAAGALSRGATLPIELGNALPKLLKDPNVHPKPLARKQMQKALQEYVQGTPYDFGNETMGEASIKASKGLRKTKLKTTFVGVFEQVTIVSFEGESPNINNQVGDIIASIGPPENTGIGYASWDFKAAGIPNCWRYDVCGGCGKKASATVVLSSCGRCKERKYCSKECQKKNFKMHKMVCSRSEEVMAELKGCLKEGAPVIMPPVGVYAVPQ
ncbi:hypothetical protein LTR17_007573 [Elasticomyces elasticus]|nr:hypothetical protein LTR17_007573 [Elasticomyces elasticus]